VPEPTHGETEADRRILAGLGLTVELSLVVLVVESVGAVFSRSLSLTLDAVHNLPDILAFATSWAALRATQKGATDTLTFGPHRREVFAGLLNATLVAGAGALFAFTAVASLLRSTPFAGAVDAVWLVAAALPTLALRASSLFALNRIPGRVRDLNLRSVLLHLASDLVITAALLAAGGLLLVRPEWTRADPIAALVIAAVLGWEAVPIVRDAWDVLSERVPRGVSLHAVETRALTVPGVLGFHDVHVWSVCPTLVCLTAHVAVGEVTVSEWAQIVGRLRRTMEQEFGIVHSVFEPEGPTAVA
jgi:cobalt-zinc-cadmium efflux system protein